MDILNPLRTVKSIIVYTREYNGTKNKYKFKRTNGSYPYIGNQIAHAFIGLTFILLVTFIGLTVYIYIYIS